MVSKKKSGLDKKSFFSNSIKSDKKPRSDNLQNLEIESYDFQMAETGSSKKKNFSGDFENLRKEFANMKPNRNARSLYKKKTNQEQNSKFIPLIEHRISSNKP